MTEDEASGLVKGFLEKAEIPFRVTRHRPIMTCEEGEELARADSALCCKNLFLKHKKKFFLLVIPGTMRLDSKALSAELGIGRLSFAGEADMARLLGTKPGAVTPLGLFFDKDREVSFLVHGDVRKAARIHCHPCRNDESLTIPAEVFFSRFPEASGHEIRWVNF